jgi:hypothetical protein
VVERQLPKLYVVGSIPIARSTQFIDIADIITSDEATRCRHRVPCRHHVGTANAGVLEKHRGIAAASQPTFEPDILRQESLPFRARTRALVVDAIAPFKAPGNTGADPARLAHLGAQWGGRGAGPCPVVPFELTSG